MFSVARSYEGRVLERKEFQRESDARAFAEEEREFGDIMVYEEERLLYVLSRKPFRFQV